MIRSANLFVRAFKSSGFSFILSAFSLSLLPYAAHSGLDAFEHPALVAAIGVEGIQGQRQALEAFALPHLGFQDLAQQSAPAQAEKEHGAVDTVERRKGRRLKAKG